MAHKIIKVSAPGKIILSGEHSVVYGQPAILTAINKRLYVEIKKGRGSTKIITDQNPELVHHALFNVIPAKAGIYTNKKMFNNLKITIRSEIPVNRGLGSSAALAVALTGALLRWFNQKWNKKLINQIAFEIEKKQHGNPSGADNTIALHGGTIIFQKGKIKRLKVSHLPQFVFIDSGLASETTREMVKIVNAKIKNQNAKLQFKIQNLINNLGKVTAQCIKTLKEKNSNQLKFLIRENERLLEELGVVGEKAKRIIKEIESLGGAAKICGAGGLKKGSGILLCYHQNPQVLLNFAQKSHLKNYQLKLGAEGLRNEN